MIAKHPGGRGRKAEHKHITFTVSLPPDLKAVLDSWVTSETSRSEVVAQLVRQKAQIKEKQTTIEPLSEFFTGTSLRVVRVKVPASLHWKADRMVEVEKLLSHGKKLTRRGHIWYTDQEGTLQNRAVEALLKTGNLATGDV
jgi:Arc/MetJ-type ribon-helix-helix transcriptional regulator